MPVGILQQQDRDLALQRDVPLQRRMQAAHAYYLQHATSEVGHRSTICSPCLQLLWTAWSADRSPGRQPERVETEHQKQHGQDFFEGGEVSFPTGHTR